MWGEVGSSAPCAQDKEVWENPCRIIKGVTRTGSGERMKQNCSLTLCSVKVAG